MMLAEQMHRLEALYRQYYSPLLCHARAALPDHTQAQDAVQDVFCEAARHMDTLMMHRNPGGWLYITLRQKTALYPQHAACDFPGQRPVSRAGRSGRPF